MYTPSKPNIILYFLLLFKKKKNSEEIKTKTTNYKPAAFHLELFIGTYGDTVNVEKFCNLILICLSSD